jgi:hypothetical protein
MWRTRVSSEPFDDTPSTFPQRWKNDAAILQYLRDRTNIPLPQMQCTFEDDAAFYYCTEFLEGQLARAERGGQDGRYEGAAPARHDPQISTV